MISTLTSPQTLFQKFSKMTISSEPILIAVDEKQQSEIFDISRVTRSGWVYKLEELKEME